MKTHLKIIKMLALIIMIQMSATTFVHAQPSCDVGFISASNQFYGGNVMFFDTSLVYQGNITNWNWTFGDGTSSNQQHPLHSYSSTGTYVVCLTITTANPLCTSTTCDTIFVTNNNSISCAAGYTYTVNGLTTSFNNSSFGAYDKVFWFFGDGSTSTAQNPVHTYANSGSYLVNLIISDSSGNCTDIYVDNVITGSTACQADFSWTLDPQTNITTFNGSPSQSGNVLTYSWDFGDGTTSTLQNPVHTFASNAHFNVCLTVYDQQINCQSTFCVLIATATGSGQTCQSAFTTLPDSSNTHFQFINSSTGINLTYFWDFGDGSTSTQQNPIHIFANAGTYTVCLTISDSQTGCTDTYCSVVTIQTGGGNCSSNYAIYPDTTAAHSYIAYNLATGIAPLTYLWSWGDSTFSNTAYPSHTYAGPGLYDICLTITDAVGCSSTTCYQWSLLRLSGGAPVTINVVQGTTGINEAESTGSLNVYPNPASGMLNIDLANPTGKPASIELYNLQGQRTMDLGTINEPSATLNVDLNNTPAGMYILKVSAGNWIEYIKVVVK